MRCLVTGGAGFIGGNLAHRLVELGHEVRILDDLSSGNRSVPGATPVEGSILDERVVFKAMRGVEAVFHQAALVDVASSFDNRDRTSGVNVDGTKRVFEGAVAAGVRRMTFASSSSVYREGPGPRRESDDVYCLSPYAESKRVAELYLISAAADAPSLDVCIFRYFNVFGPGQKPVGGYAAVIPAFVRATLESRPMVVNGSGEQTRDFVYVDDVVEANIRASLSSRLGRCRVLNVGSGREISINQLVSAVADRYTSSRIEHGPERKGDPAQSVADVSQLHEALSFRPSTPFSFGLDRTIDYLESIVQ